MVGVEEEDAKGLEDQGTVYVHHVETRYPI
jgi:hypothetical protein